MARNNATTTTAAVTADRFANASGRVTTTHTGNMASRIESALRVLEGVSAAADIETDSLAVWLPVCKLMANDTAAREAVLSEMATTLDAEIYWIASLFAGIVESGKQVHGDAYKVKFDAKNNAKILPLMGKRTIPANQLARAAYLEGIAKLSKHATEASMLATFQGVLATLVREGKIKL